MMLSLLLALVVTAGAPQDTPLQRINLVYGPSLVDSDIRGVAVPVVADADAAKARFANDPFVKAGMMTVEVHPWMAPKGWFQLRGF